MLSDLISKMKYKKLTDMARYVINMNYASLGVTKNSNLPLLKTLLFHSHEL